jgi:hypothetical protein
VSLAATYAYVTPVVAIALGWAILDVWLLVYIPITGMKPMRSALVWRRRTSDASRRTSCYEIYVVVAVHPPQPITTRMPVSAQPPAGA